MKKWKKHFVVAGVLFVILSCSSFLSGCEPAENPSSGGSSLGASSELSETASSGDESDKDITEQELDEATASQRLVAHAGGAVYGYRRTCSLEALNSSYENGFRIFEIDFSSTSDGDIALIHDWAGMASRMLFREGVMTLEEFKSSDTFMDLTLMDLDDLLKWLKEHDDCRIITDIKEDNIELLAQIYERDENASDDFIPQVYTYDEYSEAEDIGYNDIILTTYMMGVGSDSQKIDELAGFALSQKPYAVTVTEAELSEALFDAFSEQNVRIFAHSINTLDVWESWHEKGLFGIYTDYFMPDHWISE